jgi:Fe-S-cluster containining protein
MTLFKPYTQLLKDLEQLCTQLSRKHASHLSCQAGCSGCCLPGLGVFQVEAQAVREALMALPDALQLEIRQQAEAALATPDLQEHCALLHQDLCSIYTHRPVICRTHGFPVHFETEPGEIALDVCPLNFTDTEALEQLNLPDTLALDRLNLRLAAINYVYCRDELQNPALAEERISLAQLAVEALREDTRS